MRVIVYPHAMELGGSQLNAIELASGVQDLGHDVTLYADPGELVSYAQARGLEVITRRRSPLCPSPERVVELGRLAARRSAQILHGYEWPPILECHAASWGRPQLAPVGTVMSMGVAGFIPGSSPLVVGTERLRRRTAASRPGPVLLMEPPVDTVANGPGKHGEAFRASLPPAPGHLVVIVSRLAHELKLEGILTAIRCVGDLASRRDVRLVVVGDGPARREVEEAAAAANRGHASDPVILMGALEDPRGAYDAADVCIAMGGSALRAMAFSKPLIVQGERRVLRDRHRRVPAGLPRPGLVRAGPPGPRGGVEQAGGADLRAPRRPGTGGRAGCPRALAGPEPLQPRGSSEVHGLHL